MMESGNADTSDEAELQMMHGFEGHALQIAQNYMQMLEGHVKLEYIDGRHLKMTCKRNMQDQTLIFSTLVLLTSYYPCPDKLQLTTQFASQTTPECTGDITIVIPTYQEAVKDAKNYIRDRLDAGDEIDEITGDIPHELYAEVAKEYGIDLD